MVTVPARAEREGEMAAVDILQQRDDIFLKPVLLCGSVLGNSGWEERGDERKPIRQGREQQHK